jgi:hypothetical protein
LLGFTPGGSVAALGQEHPQPGLRPLHAGALDGEGGVQEHLEQQAGRVLVGLVGPESQQGRDLGARAVEARGEQLPDPGVVLRPGERADAGGLLLGLLWAPAGDAQHLPTPLAMLVIAATALALRLATL